MRKMEIECASRPYHVLTTRSEEKAGNEENAGVVFYNIFSTEITVQDLREILFIARIHVRD